jgi:hypothetical protein
MSNENVANMVDSLASGDNVAAQNAFKSALTDKIGDALDTKRQTVANDWLNAGDERESIEAGSELSGNMTDGAVGIESDAISPNDHVDFEIDDDQVVEEE